MEVLYEEYQVWTKEYRGNDCNLACLKLSCANSMMEDYSIDAALKEASTIYNIMVDSEFNDMTNYEIIEIKQIDK